MACWKAGIWLSSGSSAVTRGELSDDIANRVSDVAAKTEPRAGTFANVADDEILNVDMQIRFLPPIPYRWLLEKEHASFVPRWGVSFVRLGFCLAEQSFFKMLPDYLVRWNRML